MWPFKKSKKEEVRTVFSGEELHVNPGRKQRRARNLARIETIKQVLPTLKSGSPEYLSFQRELERRELEIKLETLRGGN